MEGAELLRAMIDVAGAAGLEVRILGAVEPTAGDGHPSSGQARLRDQVIVVLAESDPVEERLDVLAEALRTHAADYFADRFVPPAVRTRVTGEA